MSSTVITATYLMAHTDIKYALNMGRWAPDAAGRLRDAALDLFAVEGFANVTVEHIAESAGVTARTFFRHFPTKEDVLFADGNEIVEHLASAIRDASGTPTPSELLVAAITRLAFTMKDNRDHQRVRASIIASVPALRERELLKQHHIAMSIVDELVRKGMPRARATTFAGVGMVVFQRAYQAWVTDHAQTTLAARIERTLIDLKADLSA
jgi:AcrR family transcriptional regulator